MKRAFAIATLALLLGIGLFLTLIEVGAGWLNDHCQKLYKEIGGG